MIQARPVHAAALAAIHATTFVGEEAWDAAAFACQLALPGVFGLLHPDAGLVLARLAADQAEILTLAVAPPARRRGVGTELLRKAAGEAAARNAAARALYERTGFRPAGRRRSYYADGSDALVLALPLSPAAAASG
jgi:ribosomal-protein-alanine N-acetyltransferase